MTTLKENSAEIIRLIRKSEKSGMAAIDAGKILFEIKSSEKYKEEKNTQNEILYNFFGEYTTKALNISESKANNYIKIHETFTNNQDQISPNMLVSHLNILVDLDEENRNLILNAFKNIDNLDITEQKKFTKDGKPKKDIVDLKPPFESGDIQAIKNIAENVKIENQEDADDLAKEIVDLNQSSKKEAQTAQKNLDTVSENIEKETTEKKAAKNSVVDKVGKRLKSSFFSGLEDIIEHEPIDEQGFVGLFCVMLSMLKNHYFSYENQKIAFYSIIFIRDRYPDASIKFKIYGKEVYPMLKVEFQHLSSDFIRDKHLEDSQEKCDLIICWEHNIKAKKLDKYLKKLQTDKKFPKIIAFKDLLETDKIELQ